MIITKLYLKLTEKQKVKIIHVGRYIIITFITLIKNILCMSIYRYGDR